jgi:hypothetical protein
MTNEISVNEQNKILNTLAARLNVLVAYDNLWSGIKAKHLCDRLTQRLLPDFELKLSLWSHSTLQIPQLARAAEDEATETDLLIVAVSGDEALQPLVKSWISRCPRKLRPHAGALALQLNGILRMNHELSPAFECLKHIADDSGVDLFSEAVEPTGETLDSSIESIHKRAHMRSPILEAIIQSTKTQNKSTRYELYNDK